MLDDDFANKKNIFIGALVGASVLGLVFLIKRYYSKPRSCCESPRFNPYKYRNIDRIKNTRLEPWKNGATNYRKRDKEIEAVVNTYPPYFSKK